MWSGGGVVLWLCVATPSLRGSSRLRFCHRVPQGAPLVVRGARQYTPGIMNYRLVKLLLVTVMHKIARFCGALDKTDNRCSRTMMACECVLWCQGWFVVDSSWSGCPCFDWPVSSFCFGNKCDEVEHVSFYNMCEKEPVSRAGRACVRTLGHPRCCI